MSGLLSPKPAAVTLMTLSLTACAVTVPVNVTTTTGALPAGSSVELANYDRNESMRAHFGDALSEAFSSADIGLRGDGPVIAEFAIASRAADSGLADPETSTPENIVWRSQPRNPDWLDECNAMRMRATLVLLSREDGSLLYRGVAEAIDCDFSDAQYDAMADALVNDARSR